MTASSNLFYIPGIMLKPFLLWLDTNGHEVDTITNNDLHTRWIEFVEYAKSQEEK